MNLSRDVYEKLDRRDPRDGRGGALDGYHRWWAARGGPALCGWEIRASEGLAGQLRFASVTGLGLPCSLPLLFPFPSLSHSFLYNPARSQPMHGRPPLDALPPPIIPPQPIALDAIMHSARQRHLHRAYSYPRPSPSSSEPRPSPSHSHPHPHQNRSYIPSLIPNHMDPAKVDSKMFYNYVPNAVKTRKRTSPDQLQRLEKVFVVDKKPSSITRKELAHDLKMSPREVQVGLSCCALLDAIRTFISSFHFLSLRRSGFRTGMQPRRVLALSALSPPPALALPSSVNSYSF